MVSHRINYCSHRCDRPDRNKLKEEGSFAYGFRESQREKPGNVDWPLVEGAQGFWFYLES